MPQSPVEIKGEEYVVAEILDACLRHNKLEFLIKWKDICTSENNSWELEDNCRNVHNAIAAFYQKCPQVPR